MTIQNLLQLANEHQASDLHIIPDYYPTIRVNGQLTQLVTTEIITDDLANQFLQALLNEEQKATFLANNEIDVSYEYETIRYRVNIYKTRGKTAIALRLITTKIKSIDELGLPDFFHKFTEYEQGLILITGQTGTGKSTTIAAIINEINNKYTKHIITIEDPIEYTYSAAKSIISQREMHKDTYSWSLALRSVLREDPNVLLVGEMRDAETIQAVLTIAETGHLVFSTLHTGSTPESINRIIDVFPTNRQSQVRAQLASVLKAVVSQKLIPRADNMGRVPAVELLLNIPPVAANIREGKMYYLDNILETNEDQGLILFEKYLVSLYHKGLITRETAYTYAIRPSEIKKFIK